MTDTNNDSAALWASRLDDGPLDAEHDRALTDWLAGDAHRAGALLRAEACLAQARRLRAIAPEAATAAQGGIDRRRRRFTAWLLAGGGALAASLAGLMAWPNSVSYATATGEVRRIPLHDGSVVSINTASSLRVKIDDTRRRVVLDRGEAWFQVAHDTARPFVVEVGPVQVRAVGTAFSVRRRETGVDVLVTEGVVEVRTGGADAALRLSAGRKAFLPYEGQPKYTAAVPDEIDRSLAWRAGELAIDGQTLGQAAAEMNRYNDVQITVDAALSQEPLVGYFRTDDPAGFAASAATLSGGTVERDGKTLRIVAK